MATETKYAVCVQQIPEDEPIILFRAQDRTLPQLLSYYAELCNAAGSPQSHLIAINAKVQEVMDWQKANIDKVKVPD